MTQNIKDLEQLNHYRRRLKFPIIGVSGSSGKTTTMAMISAILSQSGKVYCFPFDCNTPEKMASELLQVPLDYHWAIAQMQAATTATVAREIEVLLPQIGVVTNVNVDNFARNDEVEAIAQAKSLMVKSLPENGAAILNRDNDFTREMANHIRARVKFFGLSEAADFYAANIEHLGPDGTVFTVRRKYMKSLRLRMPIYNLFDVSLSVAAVATAQELNIDDDIVMGALENHFLIPEGRGRLYRVKNIMVIDDTHHCSTQSILRSTKSLLNFKAHGTRLVFGMGSMRHMGDLTEEYHRRTGYYLAGMPIDLVFTVGRTGRHVASAMASMANGKNRKIVMYENVDMAIDGIMKELRAGDVVLVEGSQEDRMAHIVQAIIRD